MSGKQQPSIIARLGAACAFSALALAWSHARADETTNALLDLLKAKGAITQSEYDKIRARQQAEAKDSTQKLQAAETRARDAEAKAREAEAKAREAEAKAQSDSAASAAEIAKVKAQTLTAADMPVPGKAAKSPVEYVTVLPNCVGIRVGEVDICTKGDISFFGVEQFPDKNPNAPSINGGLAVADQKNSNAIRGGLLPSSFQLSLATHQAGMDIGVYLGVYTGGNNVGVGVGGNPLNANGPGAPFSLGTPGVDFRQFFGTIGTPTWGTVKVGRDIGIFASDAILNDLTLFGVGSPSFNAAPGNTSLGRIGIGYLYADFIPQISYKTPVINGFYAQVGAFTPYSTLSLDPTSTAFFTGHDLPMFQGKLSWTGTIAPEAKLTLSTSGVWQRQLADCTGALDTDGFCSGTPLADVLMPNAKVDAWAVDGFAMLDVWGWNFVAYGYTGKGVGTTGLFFNGIDIAGDARKSEGGYLQAAYTFNKVFTVGGSWGISRLDTAGATDQAEIIANCNGVGFASGSPCLVKENSSWIGFARYKLTKWVNLQAEYIATKSENQIGQTIKDDAVAVGTTFFW